MNEHSKSEPQVRSVAVGIDFGTSNSSCCIAEGGKYLLGNVKDKEVNMKHVPQIILIRKDVMVVLMDII